jgi:hypothetical protein
MNAFSKTGVRVREQTYEIQETEGHSSAVTHAVREIAMREGPLDKTKKVETARNTSIQLGTEASD